MSTVTKFNAVALTVAAMVAMTAAAPSWAGDRGRQNPLPAMGGMGFGPMPFALVDASRLTKPLRGEEPAPSLRGPEMIAAKDQLPTASPPQPLPPSVAVEAVITVASKKDY